MKNIYDAIIIGCGPAGISAALYLLRAGFTVMIIAKDNGALERAETVDNYFGIKSVSGKELLETGRFQVETLGGEILCDEVLSIAFDSIYKISTADGEYASKVIIIAAGAIRKKTSVSNAERFEGRGVSYCAVCDAFFYRNKTVAVLGSGSYALHEAGELKHSSKLYLLTNGAEPDDIVFPESIEIITAQVQELYGNDVLEGIRFADGKSIPVSGLFIAEGVAGGGEFARSLGLIIENNGIKVDENMKTSLPGVFAAGDATGGVLQISVAVGEGAKAGLSAVSFLRNSK